MISSTSGGTGGRDSSSDGSPSVLAQGASASVADGLDEAALLKECAAEPIATPGSIQGHGVLLAYALSSRRVELISGNAGSLLGLDPDAILGETVPDWLEVQTVPVDPEVSSPRTRFDNPRLLSIDRSRFRDSHATLPPHADRLYGIAHRSGDHVFLEIEPAAGLEAAAAPGSDPWVNAAGTDPLFALTKFGVNAAQSAATVEDLAARIATEVRAFTGFDRVMVYRFHENFDGSIIGEAAASDMTPFLGLRYPASDIPSQARALYLRQIIRTLVDVDAPVSPLLSRPGAGLDASADLSMCVLRSVSPVHLQYLRNMGVQATMTVSLIHDGRLWGLLACHHRTPMLVPYERRSACELLGSVMGTQFAAKALAESRAEATRRGRGMMQVVTRVNTSTDVIDGLTEAMPSLLSVFGADIGIVRQGPVLHGVRWSLTPEQITRAADDLEWEDVQRVGICEALSKPIDLDGFTESEWARLMPQDCGATPRDQRQIRFAGLLAIRLKPDLEILLFRREAALRQRWGGDPTKPVMRSDGKVARLQPRSSFAEFTQTIVGRSEPWTQLDRQLAEEFHGLIVSFVVRRLDNVARELSLRLHAEAELAKARIQTELAGRLGNIGTWEYDLGSREITDNDWYIQLGHNPAEAPRSLEGFTSLVHPEDASVVMLEFERFLAGETPDYSVQFRLWHARGDWVWVESLGQHMAGGGERSDRVVGLHYDIDQLKATQERLMAKNDELQSLVYAISHDLKAPLVTVKGFVGMLRADFDDSDYDNASRDIDRIEEATSNMAAVIDDLLMLSRLGRDGLRIGSIDIPLLFNRIAKDFEAELANAGATLEVMRPLAPLIADLPAVQRVLYNLIDNAIRYGCDGGGRIQLGCVPSPDAPGSILVVQDDGPGIPAEYRERVFGVFERLARDKPGSGVGLASVAKAAELHGGRAWVSERDDGRSGSAFRVFFPSRAVAGEFPADRDQTKIAPEHGAEPGERA